MSRYRTFGQGPSAGDPAQAWLTRLGQDGAIEWELALPEPGRPSAIAAHGDGLRVIQHQITGAKILAIDNYGVLAAAIDVPDIGDEPAQARALVAHDNGWLVAGSVDGDMWLATMRADESFQTRLTEDHLGFPDGIHHLLPLNPGYLAIASVGTTSATIDGDISVVGAVDSMLIYFDEDLNEEGRILLADEDEYVSTVTTAATQASDGVIVVVGYREPTLETGERRAWAAGLTARELSWSTEWRGPSDTQLPQRLASLHAAQALEAAVVVGGRQHTSEGIQRWHMALDPKSGQVLADELGGQMSKPFDSYLAGATILTEGAPGAVWFSGTSISSQESEQWACSLEIAD